MAVPAVNPGRLLGHSAHRWQSIQSLLIGGTAEVKTIMSPSATVSSNLFLCVNISDMKKKLLLHICCAPDATYGIEYFSKDYDVTVFFYNPNIHPEDEYRLRLIELERVARRFGVEMIEGRYDPQRWFEAVRGLEDEPEGGKRCSICFRLRLDETARVARERGFDAISTVLTISPKKDSELINRIGRAAAAKYGVEWVESNLKKGGGFKRSLELSKEFELYRQEYCGCIFSLWEAEHIRRVKTMERIEEAERNGDMVAKGARLAGTSAETLFRKQIRNQLEIAGFASIREFEFRFLGWKPLKVDVSVARTGPSFTAYPWLYSPSASGRVRGVVVEEKAVELQGMKFKRLRLSKGDIELWVRLDGDSIPLFSPYFPAMVPAISVDRQLLEFVDKKLDIQLLVEFNERARSGILLAWNGQPKLAVTAPIDSFYNSPGWNRKHTALKLLELAIQERPADVLFAFLGAEEIGGMGFRKLMDVLPDMFPKLNRIIRMDGIARGELIELRRSPGFDDFPTPTFPFNEAEIQPIRSFELMELRGHPDPFYHHPDDLRENLDEALTDAVMNWLKNLMAR